MKYQFLEFLYSYLVIKMLLTEQQKRTDVLQSGHSSPTLFLMWEMVMRSERMSKSCILLSQILDLLRINYLQKSCFLCYIVPNMH